MIGLLLGIIYMSFISLGLPDAVMASAWPVISYELEVAVSNMGIITIIISIGTIISGLNSDRLINKIGIHKITYISILITAIALFGFSRSTTFIELCFWAIPYGLGAGSIDTALNNYAAINFQSKHMNWLHCMWGVGATLGPYIMGMALTNGLGYQGGYKILFAIQGILAVIIYISNPLWKSTEPKINYEEEIKSLSLKEIFKISGAKEGVFSFFCFTSIEQTTGLWASSYLVYNRGMEPKLAAGFSALFYLGITLGRGLSGFIAMKYNNKQMIRGGIILMACGILTLLISDTQVMGLAGLSLIGLGSAPVFPSLIHSTPNNFGIKNSQSITGVQMAGAYTGLLIMPATFGILGKNIGFNVYPIFLGILTMSLVITYEKLLRKVENLGRI